MCPFQAPFTESKNTLYPHKVHAVLRPDFCGLVSATNLLYFYGNLSTRREFRERLFYDIVQEIEYIFASTFHVYLQKSAKFVMESPHVMLQSQSVKAIKY
jgi:hypothetical protein